MGFQKTVGNALSMIFFIILSWVVGIFGFIVLIIFIYQALLHKSRVLGTIGAIIGIGIIGIAFLIYTHFTNKHDIDFQPGYRTRTRIINY